MNILIDGRLYGLENAGLGRYLINLVRELSKIDKKNNYYILLREKYFNELALPDNWKKVKADFRHYSFVEQIKLPAIINNINPDVTHFPHFDVPFFYQGSFVVTVHDMLMHNFNGVSATTLPMLFYFLKQVAYKLDFRRAVTKSLAIIVPSKTVKSEIIDYYKINPAKITVTYEGVDEKIDGQGFISVDQPYFVYSGNAYPHKNLNRLIQAIVLLNKRTPKKITLAIVSSRGVFTERLEKDTRKAHAENYVKLLGFVSDDKLGSLYKNSVGFVFPSLSEGFGLPGLEAMASGTILLASNIPVFREIYGDQALYFNELEISSIEKVMRKVLEMDSKQRDKTVKSNKEFVKRYSWAKMATETLRVYEKAANKSSRKLKSNKR